jgi:WD40 repeat protein
MEINDPSRIFFSSSSSEGKISVWSLKDLLSGKSRLTFQDSVSHLSPVKAMSWNPLHTGVFATGGSSPQDSVIRLYDINNLSVET